MAARCRALLCSRDSEAFSWNKTSSSTRFHAFIPELVINKTTSYLWCLRRLEEGATYQNPNVPHIDLVVPRHAENHLGGPKGRWHGDALLSRTNACLAHVAEHQGADAVHHTETCVDHGAIDVFPPRRRLCFEAGDLVKYNLVRDTDQQIVRMEVCNGQ